MEVQNRLRRLIREAGLYQGSGSVVVDVKFKAEEMLLGAEAASHSAHDATQTRWPEALDRFRWAGIRTSSPMLPATAEAAP